MQSKARQSTTPNIAMRDAYVQYRRKVLEE
jgi:ABC-type transporter lipoprotein component MlaA